VKKKVINKHRTALFWIGLLVINIWFTAITKGEVVSLGNAERFLFLTPTRIYEGGGGNSYIGDIGAPNIISWNPDAFVGTWVRDRDTLDAAVTDAIEFSNILMQLPVDDVISSYCREWHTVKPGLNVVTLLESGSGFTELPQIVMGGPADTVVCNVLASGEVIGGIQVRGGLFPENLVVNYLNASWVLLGSGVERIAGTYLIRSGLINVATGGNGLDGAVIAAGNIDIDIGGGGNLFVHHPLDASAIPEPATILLLGSGAAMLLRKKRIA